MMSSTFAVLIIFGCTTLIQGTDSCDEAGPANCTFQNVENKLYSWRSDENVGLFQYKSNTFIGLNPGHQEGQLVSRTACSTQNQTHCLKFQYTFEKNNISDLSVSIVYNLSFGSEQQLWTQSSSVGWEEGEVPITTQDNFWVSFNGRRRPETSIDQKTAFIDNITYVKSPCLTYNPPTTQQPAAVTNITFKMCTSEAEKPTRDALTTGCFGKKVTDKAVDGGNLSTTITLPTTQVTTIAEESLFNSVGVIIDTCAVAVVVVAIVIILVLVLFKRKRAKFSICFRRKAQAGVEMYQSTLYNLDRSDVEYVNGAELHATQGHLYSHPIEARTSSTQPQADYEKASDTIYVNLVDTGLTSECDERDHKGRQIRKELVQSCHYSSLDFESRGREEVNNESGSGTIYNHLGEGGEDAYNEVNTRKVNIIAGEYSHIK